MLAFSTMFSNVTTLHAEEAETENRSSLPLLRNEAEHQGTRQYASSDIQMAFKLFGVVSESG